MPNFTIVSNSLTPQYVVDFEGFIMPNNLLMWWDISQELYNNGDPINSYTDYSLNGNSGTCISGTTKSIFQTNRVNGKPSARFTWDGVSTAIEMIGTGDLQDLYFVARINQNTFHEFGGHCETLMEFFSGSKLTGDQSNPLRFRPSDIAASIYELDGVDSKASGAVGFGSAHVYRLAGSPGTSGIRWGYGFRPMFDLDFCEAIGFGNVLSSGDSAALLATLKTKWGIP